MQNRSTENDEEPHKSWYHYPNTEDRLEHFEGDLEADPFLSDNEENDEMDEEQTAKYKLEPEAKEILQESWKHLQIR